MAQSNNRISGPHFPIARSDNLGFLRALLYSVPASSESLLEQIVQFRFVVDSNIVLNEIVWLATKRRQPDARTDLQELIDSGTAVVFAPSFLEDEIREHIPRRASELGIPEQVLHDCWQDYKHYLKFSPGDLRTTSDVPLVDPDDLPFVALYHDIGAAAVISNNHKHISRMGASCVGPDAVRQLRDYSRAKSVEMSVVVGGTCITIAASAAVIKALVSFARVVGHLPKWLCQLLLACVVVLLIYPNGRKKIVDILKRALSTSQVACEHLRPLACECFEVLEAAAVEANKSLSVVRETVRTSRRTPLRTVAYAVCLAASTPLPLPEIQKRVRMNGYISRAKDPATYLRRVLAKDARFSRTTNGHWETQGATPPLSNGR